MRIKKLKELLLILCILCNSLPSFAQTSFDYLKDFKPVLAITKDSTGSLFYDSLLNRFKKHDPSLSKYETLALLIGFTDNPHYDPYNDMETEKNIFDINDKGEYDEALKLGKEYIETHPLSLRVLKEISYSYNQLGKRDSAKFYMELTDKIMSAMIFSGKGRTPENPIFSLALNDGEQFVPNVGMTILNKTTATNKGKLFMEVINAKTDEGKILNFFFVIQHAKEKMDGNNIQKVPKVNKKKSKKEPVKKW